MKTKFLLISLLCIGLLSCEKDNQREKSVNYPKGAIKGVFSVSETEKVVFSQGNLQYQASTDTWRFAEHQYDMVGMGYGLINEDRDCYVAGNVQNSDNRKISSTYDGWIDLFGWGTGDNPTKASGFTEDYSTFVDWGVNEISNGGNQVNLWRTLTMGEWYYLLSSRLNASAKSGVAYVNGINGLVLLPDDWTLPSGAHFTSGYADDFGPQYYNYKGINSYTISEWEVMESAGAVFLPAAGERGGTSMGAVGKYGYYWSSTYDDIHYAHNVAFSSDCLYPQCYGTCNYGQSVRLCSEL